MTEANLCTTPILDHEQPEVQRVAALFDATLPPRTFLQQAHGHISKVMRAVYSIEETMPISRVFSSNQGSCSQRMACVEGLARAQKIRTRVQALWLDRTFWYSRLPLLRPFLPKKGILMPWPQFLVDGNWLDFGEIYDSIPQLVERATHPFTNRGESMYDAISHAPVDYFGKAKQSSRPEFSLASIVVSNDGFFDTRDELIEKLERQTWAGRLLFKALYEGKPVRRLPE